MYVFKCSNRLLNNVGEGMYVFKYSSRLLENMGKEMIRVLISTEDNVDVQGRQWVAHVPYLVSKYVSMTATSDNGKIEFIDTGSRYIRI